MILPPIARAAVVVKPIVTATAVAPAARLLGAITKVTDAGFERMTAASFPSERPKSALDVNLKPPAVGLRGAPRAKPASVTVSAAVPVATPPRAVMTIWMLAAVTAGAHKFALDSSAATPAVPVK